MSKSDDRLKILQIKLNINMKGHQTMVYAPYMTIPGQSGDSIFFMPTIPLSKARISEALEAINNKKPTNDEIIKVFFSKVDILNTINKMIEIAQQRGTPLFPLQFKSDKDLIGGKITHSASGKFIFKKEGDDGMITELVPISKSIEQKDKTKVNKLSVNFVRAKNFKYEEPITVSNVSLNMFPQPENTVKFEFKNSVRSLTIGEATKKGIISNNIKFITSLLFSPEQKFYYKGNVNFDFDIFSYSVDKSQRDQSRIWDVSGDGNIFAITVRLRIKPLARELDKKTAHKTQQLQGCQLTRAEIIRQWHELNSLVIPDHLDSAGMVDDPEGSGPQSSQFKTSQPISRMPASNNIPSNDSLVPRPLGRGGKKTKRRRNKRGHRSRKYQR